LAGSTLARYTLLLSHGNAVDIGQLLPYMLDLSERIGCSIFTYDYSGSVEPSFHLLLFHLSRVWFRPFASLPVVWRGPAENNARKTSAHVRRRWWWCGEDAEYCHDSPSLPKCLCAGRMLTAAIRHFPVRLPHCAHAPTGTGCLQVLHERRTSTGMWQWRIDTSLVRSACHRPGWSSTACRLGHHPASTSPPSCVN
jgi:hypothetical protein